MSLLIHPYAVDLDELRHIVGSRNASYLRALREQFAEDLADLDASDDEDAEGDDRVISATDALADLIAGGPYREGWHHAPKYGYVLRLLCEDRGEMRPNSWTFAEEADRLLEAAGVPAPVLRVGDHLTYRGAPVAMPEPDDFPSIGYLEATEARVALRALPRSAVGCEPMLSEIRGWLDYCSNQMVGLVAFTF